MAVIGLTPRNDAVDLLEKRVRSRFSQHILTIPPALTTVDEVTNLLSAALGPPRMDLVAPPEGAAPFANAWAQATRVLCAEVVASPHWRRLIAEGKIVPGQLVTAVRVLLSEIRAEERPMPTLARLDVPSP
eukprot:1984917-Prymnesium_polylepis.1